MVLAETQIESLDNFFTNKTNIKIIKDLIQNLKIKDYNIKEKSGKFSNKRIMFTGGFQNMSRSEAKEIVENNGGKVLEFNIKKTRFLGYWRFKANKKKN